MHRTGYSRLKRPWTRGNTSRCVCHIKTLCFCFTSISHLEEVHESSGAPSDCLHVVLKTSTLQPTGAVVYLKMYSCLHHAIGYLTQRHKTHWLLYVTEQKHSHLLKGNLHSSFKTLEPEHPLGSAGCLVSWATTNVHTLRSCPTRRHCREIGCLVLLIIIICGSSSSVFV